MSKKSAALENVNIFLLNQKLDEHIVSNNMNPLEDKCRLVRIVLRHKVHHFPVNIPFIAVIKKCGDEQQVVYNIKRSKLASIKDIDIASETKVGSVFSIDNVSYEVVDTIHGFPRYKPIFNKKK